MIQSGTMVHPRKLEPQSRPDCGVGKQKAADGSSGPSFDRPVFDLSSCSQVHVRDFIDPDDT